MVPDASQRLFQVKAAVGGGPVEAQALAERLKRNAAQSELQALAAIWLHASVAQPEILAAVWDAAAEGWLGAPVDGPPIALPPIPPELIPPGFWEPFWVLVADRPTLTTQEISTRIAALAEHRPVGLAPRLIKAGRSEPASLTRDTPAHCPPLSLAAAFQAAPDPSALHLWRLLAGYQQTALHGMALSAFQIAQSGDARAALALAVELATASFLKPERASILLDIALSAWKHGRETPSMMTVDWPAVWDLTVEQVRERLGVTPYVSPWPADLFEQMDATA